MLLGRVYYRQVPEDSVPPAIVRAALAAFRYARTDLRLPSVGLGWMEPCPRESASPMLVGGQARYGETRMLRDGRPIVFLVGRIPGPIVLAERPRIVLDLAQVTPADVASNALHEARHCRDIVDRFALGGVDAVEAMMANEADELEATAGVYAASRRAIVEVIARDALRAIQPKGRTRALRRVAAA
jgi:hypothetical protein